MISLILILAILCAFFVGYVFGIVAQVTLTLISGRTILLVPAVMVDLVIPFPPLRFLPLVTLLTILTLLVRTLLRRYMRV